MGFLQGEVVIAVSWVVGDLDSILSPVRQDGRGGKILNFDLQNPKADMLVQILVELAAAPVEQEAVSELADGFTLWISSMFFLMRCFWAPGTIRALPTLVRA